MAGERLHDGVLDWLAQCTGNVLEVGAGSGRLTLHLACHARHVTAAEPAAPLRKVLHRRLAAAGVTNVRVVHAFFDSLPTDRGHDAVVSCSAFSVSELSDADQSLGAIERACAPGGLVVLVWPRDVGWLTQRGYEHVVFEGPMLVEYASVEEAIELARIFYPDAAQLVTAGGSRFVDFRTLGLNAPRDLCWKRMPAEARCE